MKIRQTRGKKRARPRLDFKTARIARDLETFLKARRARSIRLCENTSIHLQTIASPAVKFGIALLRARFATKIAARSVWKELGEHLSARLTFALGPTFRLQDAAAKAVARSDSTVRTEITLRETMLAFPGVLDVAARIISAWLDAQRELLNRVLSDEASLKKYFIRPKRRFRVVHIRPGLSDPHDFGRTVTFVRFPENRRVVYKPRSADRELLWFESLRWLNRNGFSLSFRTPKLIPRENYCWMELVASRSCKTLRAVRDFYVRWGAQAALAQLLLATDLHRENWVPAGSQPVLADAELIGDAVAPRKAGRSLAHRRFPLLLQTGLLPLTLRDRLGSYEAMGPFDGRIPSSIPPDCWPKYNQVRQEPRKYVRELARGFEVVAKIFGNSTASTKFFHEVIAPHNNCKTRRVLLRPSAQYARLLRASLEPIHLSSAESRWRYLLKLCSAKCANSEVALAEAEALLWCDIPKIEMRATTPLVSWERFSAAVAELQNSVRLFRSRVLLKRASA